MGAKKAPKIGFSEQLETRKFRVETISIAEVTKAPARLIRMFEEIGSCARVGKF